MSRPPFMPGQRAAALAVGSLFSGIGGLELGLEWAGLGPVRWQVEQDAWCRSVLAKHWPDAVRHDDVRTAGAHNLDPVDVVCGGFPCQDISSAGKRAGLTGARSGLWHEYARIVRQLRPRFVVVENVAALASLGLDTVLGDLAALGFDAWWDCVRATDVGAPHRRERLFVVAYARSELRQRRSAPEPGGDRAGEAGLSRVLGAPVADAGSADGEARDDCAVRGAQSGARRGFVREPASARRGRRGIEATESGVGRVPHGIPALVDGRWPARPGEAQHDWEPPRTAKGVPQRTQRLKALGNAVVPQVAYAIGRVVRAIAESEGA